MKCLLWSTVLCHCGSQKTKENLQMVDNFSWKMIRSVYECFRFEWTRSDSALVDFLIKFGIFILGRRCRGGGSHWWTIKLGTATAAWLITDKFQSDRNRSNPASRKNHHSFGRRWIYGREPRKVDRIKNCDSRIRKFDSEKWLQFHLIVFSFSFLAGNCWSTWI